MNRLETVDNATDEELETLEIALEDVDKEFEQAWKNSLKTYEDEESVFSNFAPETFGHHEIVDRISLMSCNWEDFILNHPSISMHRKAYRIGQIVAHFMANLYQELGCMPYEDEVDTDVMPSATEA
jgi:hypothetical protein